MNIVEIVDMGDGTKRAVITDDEGNYVGYTTFTDESYPQPQVTGTEEPGFWRRAWNLLVGS